MESMLSPAQSAPRPPAGRRAARKQDRRDAILAVAQVSFLERGYAGTTMSGIAATLGGSKGTLWSYFPSKEALFDAMLDHATIAFRTQMLEILNPCGDIRATLARFCANLLEKVVEPEAIALNRLVVAETGRFPEVGRIFHDRTRAVSHARLSTFLAAAMDRGLLRRADAGDAALALFGLALGGCHHQLLVGAVTAVTAAQLQADVDRTLDLFLRAYAR